MSDQRLRQLERASALGDLGAGVQFLREKMRLGLLDEERLSLAAYLGDPAALVLRPHRAAPEGCDDETWLGGLIHWDRSITVRAYTALAREQTVSLRAPGSADPGSGSLRTRCLGSVHAWLEDPNDATLAAVDAAERALRATGNWISYHPVFRAALAVLSHPPVTSAPKQLTSTRLREIVRTSVAGWALGRRDPLPMTTPPPARLARGFGGFDWDLAYVAQLVEDDVGVRIEAQVGAAPDAYRVWRAGGARERLTVIRGDEDVQLYDARAWESFRHPDVTPVFGSGSLFPGRVYVLEADPQGESLMAWRGHAQPTPADAARLFVRVARAVEAVASLLEAVHLRPARVSVRADGSPVLHGLLVETLTRHYEPPFPHMSAVGGWGYFSPEEATEASPVGAESTVYRLGCSLYALWVGHAPFVPRTAKVLLKILDEPPPPPSSLVPGISPDLEAVVLRALAKRPDERYPSPAAFADALSAAL